MAQMVKVSAYSVGDLGSIPGSGSSPGEGNATHSSTLAWKIPQMEDPGGLQTMVLQRVGHDWTTSVSLFKITVDGDCSHDIKRHLLLGRKALTSLDSVFKSRDITLLTKVYIVVVTVFPGVMYRCESWTIKKAEPPKIEASKLWCWKRLFWESLGQQGNQTSHP